MAIQIGKYKRPGIFIEEFDNSVIVSPTVTGTNTFVAGFSKKGPVNTPVLLQTISDLERIFGPLDRNLERKGSFFHRTVSKLLESNPVYAMNLLSTSDTLDTLEYKSLSTRTDKTNDIVREGPYRRFFDTTGFWKKDTDSFINLTSGDVGDDDRLLHFTNMSDKYISVFAFKTRLTGYDRPLLEFYGTLDRVPDYLNPLDYASDYMIDIVVVGGDWSNYSALSVDTKWSEYFDADGLDKTKVRDFASDRNVNLLAYYEGLSLIPFFRDNNGRNIFVETIVNNDTDRTGLFCAFNMDKFETDYVSGMVDLTGNNLLQTDGLVNNGQTSIEFLSYQDSLIEILDYTATPLDIPGGSNGQNVFALGASVSNEIRSTWGGVNRTAFFSEEYINGVLYSDGSQAVGTSSFVVGYDLSIPSSVISGLTTSYPYGVIGAEKLLINSGTSGTFTYSVDSTTYPVSSTTASYVAVSHVDSTTGEIKLTTTTTAATNPTLPANDLVLNYFNYDVVNGEILTSTFQVSNVGINVEVDPTLTFAFTGAPSASTTLTILSEGVTVSSVTSSGDSLSTFLDDVYTDVFSEVAPISVTVSGSSLIFTAPNETYEGDSINLTLVAGSASSILVNGSATSTLSFSGAADPGFNELEFGTDYTVTDLGSGKIRVTFLDTAAVDVTSAYERHRKIRLFNSMVSMLNSADIVKVTMLKDLVTEEKLSLENASISNIVTASTSNKSFDLTLGVDSVPQAILDGNLVFYKLDNELVLGETGLVTKSTLATATASGVVAKYSDLYQNFYDGQINTGDFFHKNLVNPQSPIRVVFQVQGAQSYIWFSDTPNWSPVGNEQIVIAESTLNTSAVTLSGNVSLNEVADPVTGVTFSTGFAYSVDEDVVDEDLSSVSYVLDFTDKAYLKMYTDSDEVLYVDFVDETLTSTNSISTTNDSSFLVFTNKTNYKQTIEIEEPAGYTPVSNKILINGSRYTEVKVGDFLEGQVDTEPTNPNEKARNLVRILSKRLYSADSTLVEISCDGPIEKYDINGDLQTMRYTSIEDYVSTYKAITMKGFRVREASMPDGTEERQNSILNLMAKGTTLFKALTNKEAIDFRYVIDSFGLGLIERSKQQLVDLCGERLDCFGFLNMPSMKSFKNSTSPTFVDSEGVLQTSFIAQGGDPESSPAFLYSFGDGRGVSSVGYFLPYVTVNDNGRPADVPPAMYVATTYLRKINANSTSIVPWTIAAGITNGRVTNIASVEQNFSLEDIENLNGAQMNPIVFKRNRGYVIETENTGQTLFTSALSFIHVREVLIELERELSAMLLEYQWKFNTPDVRAEIKLRADVICETYVNRNGLFNYFNKCDEENNTPEIIDNQIGVLDTYVEPIRGMGIIVNNITILRTGSIQAGGFISQ